MSGAGTSGAGMRNPTTTRASYSLFPVFWCSKSHSRENPPKSVCNRINPQEMVVFLFATEAPYGAKTGLPERVAYNVRYDSALCLPDALPWSGCIGDGSPCLHLRP